MLSLLAKCVLRTGEMASQVRFGPRVRVWRTLIWTTKRRGDSTHHCRSTTPTMNGCTPSTRTQSSEQEYSYLPTRTQSSEHTVIWRPARGTRQHRTP